MAVGLQPKSDKLVAALDPAIPRVRHKTTNGIKTKAQRGFARPTKASKLKQVNQTPQAVLVGGAKCESVVMLKNLAKLLVERIEAACEARIQAQVPNPKRSLSTDLRPNPNPKSNPKCNLSTDLATGPRRNANKEGGGSQEFGSTVDVDELRTVSTQKASSNSLTTPQPSRQLNDDRSYQSIQETERSCGDASQSHGNRRFWETSVPHKPNDSRPSSQPNPNPNPSGSTWERCRPNYSRPSSQPNLSGNNSDTSGYPDSRPSSRTPSRDWTGNPVRKLPSLTSRMLTLTKVNVGLDDCEIKPPQKAVHPTSGRKLWSPGLRSLVVQQQVRNLPTPPARPPANTKLLLSGSSKATPKEGKRKDDPAAQKEVKASEGEELREPVWTDVIQNVFDEVFGDQPRQATLAMYHMDKIERYKKCIAEKQMRDARRLHQDSNSSRPSTAPDPYNVLNVYSERYASQKFSKPPALKASASAEGRRELHKPSEASNRAHERRRAMSAGSVPPQNQPLHGEMDRSINLLQKTRGVTYARREKSSSELKERRNPENWFLNDAGDNQKLQPAVKDLQAPPACTEVVPKKTRFTDHWPLLDRQIEAFIQAHILQCCILFKNTPPVFPTLDYQEEIQKIYSGHPHSTR